MDTGLARRERDPEMTAIKRKRAARSRPPFRLRVFVYAHSNLSANHRTRKSVRESEAAHRSTRATNNVPRMRLLYERVELGLNSRKQRFVPDGDLVLLSLEMMRLQIYEPSFRAARSASPESITTTGSMDSRPAPRGASRNDG